MNKHAPWLHRELERWVDEKLVSPEQATHLRQRYPVSMPAFSWGLIVFATTGALVVGLGVILLLAYNWDGIPKFGKLALIFGAMAGAHAAGLHWLRQDDWRRKLGEAMLVLGTMFFGAAIWLVAQIYNIDEHYPNGFLTWAAGALVLAWVIRSTALGILAVLLVGIWGGCEAVDFNRPGHWAMLVVVLGVAPLAWRNRSAVLLALCVAATQALLLLNLGVWGAGAHLFTASLAFAVLLAGAARLSAAVFSGGARVMEGFGYGVFLVCAYLLTFRGATRGLLDWERAPGWRPEFAVAIGWGLFAIAIALWAWVARRALLARELAVERTDWLLPIALLYAFGIAAIGARGWEQFVAWSFTALLLGLAAWWMWRGCQQSRLGITVLGSVVLTALVAARYFDLFQSMASRGLAFIVLGGLFLAEALYYRKIRRHADGGAP
jgi:uncharacterized membrane protein